VTGPLDVLLEDLHARLLARRDGEVATYIPQLALADPDDFGLALATLDGRVYEVGSTVPFTIQSVSKPFAYALALADRGVDAVLAAVGVEPTGDPFNSISLDDATSRPYNPMVNAGAIVTTSMVAGATRDEQFARVLTGLSAFAGRTLEVDEAVFASERETGDRNRAIAYLARTVGLLDPDVDGVLDVYFRQCAVLVTARDLAVMAATLAGGGVNPITREQVVPREIVGRVLTVMTTCGMYDYAGEWLYRVGLPAKSGVSGGISAALPGQLGIGVRSPLLDPRGNSVRGIAACEELSDHFGLHLLHSAARVPSGVRRTYRADTTRSQRIRLAAERALLDEHGSSIAVHELAGDQVFATAEHLVRTVLEDPLPARWRILDLRRVTRMDTAAVALLKGLVATATARGVSVVIVKPAALQAVRALTPLTEASSDAVVDHWTNDASAALEWCEGQILAGHGVSDGLPEALVPLAEQDLLSDLPADLLARLEKHTTTVLFSAGTVVFDEGTAADGMYFVAAGQVIADVRARRGDGTLGAPRRRLSTVGSGSSFGELALVDGSPRSTRIVADDPTLCYHLSGEAFTRICEEEPELAAALFRAIAISLSSRLRRLTVQMAALESA
jgi:glutaminase